METRSLRTLCYAESAFAVKHSSDWDQRQAAWLRKFDPSLCFVAWAGNRVAAQVACRMDKGRGEIAEVSVREPWRRQGLARALLTRGLVALIDNGMPMARLHTVAENRYGSIDLYTSVGFRVVKDHIRYRKPMIPETGVCR